MSPRPLLASALLASLACLPLQRASAQCMHSDDSFGVPGVVGGGEIHVLASLDFGTGPVLVAGGLFNGIGGVSAPYLAQWNGSSWAPVGTATLNGPVNALAVFDDGTGPGLYVGGDFNIIGTENFSERIARWNGTSWSHLGTNFSTNAILALTVFDDGTGAALIAGGNIFMGAGITNVAKWNGTSWSALGNGLNDYVHALATYDDGAGTALYAAGDFYLAGQYQYFAKWTGFTWTAPAQLSPNSQCYALAVYDDGSGPGLYVGGGHSMIGSLVTRGIARWDGSFWSALGGGLYGPGGPPVCDALAVLDSGDGPELVAGGQFSIAGGVPASCVARWNGASWSGFGSGVNARALALAVHDGGTEPADLVVGGYFTTADGSPSTGIARWRTCGTGTPFCFGDGSVTACPCANDGASARGCANSSVPNGARCWASGSASLDTVVLHSIGEPASALSIFLQGAASIAPVAFGDGLRCVGGILKRLYVEPASSGLVDAPNPGDPSIQQKSALLGDPIAPGSTRYYQIYYRDPVPAFCPAPAGNTWNVSNGVGIDW